jgi:hypothetical protein
MSIADFGVDETAIDLLRFDETARQMLTGGEIVQDHKADWSRQTDHLFSENLQVAAASLLVHDPSGVVRVADFAEFAARLQEDGIPPALADLFAIFGRCKRSLVENPVFWLRLVGYGSLCNDLVDTLGVRIGFRQRPYDSVEMLRRSEDEAISADPAKYAAGLDVVKRRGL